MSALKVARGSGPLSLRRLAKHTNAGAPPPPIEEGLDRSRIHLNDKESIKKTLSPSDLSLRRFPVKSGIPGLSYGLERVLFNPGVHWLRDPRSNVYNFDPFLRTIPAPAEFKLKEAIPDFIPASKDTELQRMALDEDCTFVTSTSSISQSMASIYFVLSRMKALNLDAISASFIEEPRSFTALTRSPSAVLLKPHGPNLRSIVVEKLDEPENILQQLGQILERLLTEPKENFHRMLKNNSERPRLRPSEAYSIVSVTKHSALSKPSSRLVKFSCDLNSIVRMKDFHAGRLI